MNSCETIAKAQTDPKEYKLDSAFKLFNRNIKQIFKMSDKLFHENYDKYDSISISYIKTTIENPFDFVDINYRKIESHFSATKNGVRNGNVDKYISVYHYPMIYEEYVATKSSTTNTRLIPTNDIIVYIPDTVRKIFKIADESSRLYDDNGIMKNSKYIEFIKGNNDEVPEPLLIHVPDDSFYNVSNLITAAAMNPDKVEEICLTAYRLGKNNKMIDDIIKATNNKIHCKLFIELSARGEIERDKVYLKCRSRISRCQGSL